MRTLDLNFEEYESNQDHHNEYHDHDELLEQEHENLEIGDCDKFFTSLYTYYRAHGLLGVISKQLCASLSLVFTVALSSFLIGFVKWRKLLDDCGGEGTCEPIAEYLEVGLHGWEHVMVVLYIMVFASYTLWRVCHAYWIVKESFYMHRFCTSVLQISTEQLQVMSWSQVLQAVARAEQRGACTISSRLGNGGLELEAALRLMRKENYLIAMTNSGVLGTTTPSWAAALLGTGNTGLPYMSSSLEWVLSVCVMEYLFIDPHPAGTLDGHENASAFLREDIGASPFLRRSSSQFYRTLPSGEKKASRSFLSNPEALQRRFQVMGAILLVLLPFTVVFSCMQFFLLYAQNWRSEKRIPRAWSPAALWTFREYNELSHCFDARLRHAAEPAAVFLGTFPSPFIDSLARCIAHITGAIAASLVVLSFTSEVVLVEAQVGDHNLLWWLALTTSVYATANACAPAEDLRPTPSRQVLLAELASHTHYHSENLEDVCDFDSIDGSEDKKDREVHYRQRVPGDSYTFETPEITARAQLKVRAELSALFPYKVQLFFAELLSSVITPLALLSDLSTKERCSNILRFLKARTRHVPGTGAVCEFALFDFRPAKAAKGAISHQLQISGRSSDTSNHSVSDTAYGKKMEASYVSFARHNPQWRQGPAQAAGQSLLEKLDNLRSKCQKTPPPDISNTHDGSCGAETAEVPAVLRSVLNQQGLDWQNDHYWLNRFQRASKGNNIQVEQQELQELHHDNSEDEGDVMVSAQPLPDFLKGSEQAAPTGRSRLHHSHNDGCRA